MQQWFSSKQLAAINASSLILVGPRFVLAQHVPFLVSCRQRNVNECTACLAVNRAKLSLERIRRASANKRRVIQASETILFSFFSFFLLYLYPTRRNNEWDKQLTVQRIQGSFEQQRGSTDAGNSSRGTGNEHGGGCWR